MTFRNPLTYLAGRREDLCQGKARRMGLTRLLQAPHGGRPLLVSLEHSFVHPANPRDALLGSNAAKVGPPVSKHSRATHLPRES